MRRVKAPATKETAANATNVGAHRLVSQALSDMHAASMSYGAASTASYGSRGLTRSVRHKAAKRLQQAARAYYLACMTVREMASEAASCSKSE